MNNFPSCLQLVDKYLVVPDLSTALSLDRPKNQKTASLVSGKFFITGGKLEKKGILDSFLEPMNWCGINLQK
jgi:hypothetical protein